MGHRENVRSIKEAFKTINVKKWEAGDAALAEVPKGQHGGDRKTDQDYLGSHDQIRALAEEAGVEFDALRIYRDVASAWPATTRVAAASWTVHRELMGFKPTPQETSAWLKDFIKKLAAQAQKKGIKRRTAVTADEVRAERGKAPSRITRPQIGSYGGGRGNGGNGPSSPVDVDAVKAALTDPQVVAAIVNDPTTGGVIAHAQNEMIDTLKSQAKTAQKQRQPGLVANTEYLAVCGRLRSARYQLVQALETVRGIDPITQKIKDGVLEDVEEVQLVLDWLRSYLNTQDESFDEALQKLLREGA